MKSPRAKISATSLNDIRKENLDAREILSLRMANQFLSHPAGSAKKLVTEMVALQAQDLLMSLWAVGCRVSGATQQSVLRSFGANGITRTHVLRPTWHLVLRPDLAKVNAISADRIRNSMKGRHRQLQLSDPVIKKALNVITEVLSKEKQLRRDELVKGMKEMKIRVDENRASHLFMLAEISGLITGGRPDGNHQTYVLLGDEQSFGEREKAIGWLARKYFKTRGPATVVDFAWWSGLSLTEARAGALVAAKGMARSELGGKIYLFYPSAAATANNDEVRLLPAYDEYLLSYADRGLMLEEMKKRHIVSENGIFYPTVVRNGIVIGTWKKQTARDQIQLQVNLFQKRSLPKEMISAQIEKYAQFLGNVVKLA